MSRKARRDEPGPGHYKVPDLFGNTGVHSPVFGSRKLATEIELKPGPGQYAPNAACSRSQARCLFGMNPRFKQSVDESPGPCEYTPRNPNATAERKSIGEKSAVLPGVINANPG